MGRELHTVIHRIMGANKVSKSGGVACIISFIANITYETLHTGTLWYINNSKKLQHMPKIIKT